MKTKRHIPFLNPDLPLDKSIVVTDPLGSYTGVPLDPNEMPVQDADDL